MSILERTWSRRMLLPSGAVCGAVLAALLPHAEATMIVGPPAPGVVSVGSRYVSITPGKWGRPFAIEVLGFPPTFEHPDDADVSCVAAYVQANGTLGAIPVYRTNAAWGLAVAARGVEIIPHATYTARAVDADVGAGAAVALARTWRFGDTDGDEDVDIDDLDCVLDAFGGSPCTPHGADLGPCATDGVYDIDDIYAVLEAFTGEEFECAEPCP